MTTKLPIDVIATEKMIRGHEICLSYTDPFGFTRTAYAKFNFRDFHFERDNTLPEPKKASILDVMDVDDHQPKQTTLVDMLCS